MTTQAKPLPAHGTYARANGCPGYRDPCKCDPCKAEHRRVRKHRRVNRQLGHPSLVDATPAHEYLNRLRQRMTWEQIFTALGHENRDLHRIAGGRQTRIRRATLAQILAIQPAPPAPGKYVDATGTRRRIQALRALGYSARAIAEAAGTEEEHARLISSGAKPVVRHWFAQKINTVFAELHRAPAPAGRSATLARNYAKAQGWAPPAAWDDIDAPDAAPEWTGHCGTDHGWWLHKTHHIPTCARCQTAHTDWLTERKHLPSPERFRQLALAKAAASNRGASLAHDARELMRVSGLDTEQAAERLGVTRDHLRNELLRHPA